MAQVRGGRPNAAITRGCSSPACPASTLAAAPSAPGSTWQRRCAAQRPGCQGAYAPPPGPRAAPGAPRRPRGPPRSRPPRTPRGPGPTSRPARASPVSTAPIRSGWSGSAASSEASSACGGPAVDRRGSAPTPGAPGRGRKTRPISNSAVSAKPRPTLRARTRNSPGSSGRAQQRLVLAERVGDPHRRAARVLGRQPEQVGVARARRTGRAAPRRSRPRPASGRPTGAAAAAGSARARPARAASGPARSRSLPAG